MSNLSDLIARVRVAGITGKFNPDLAREVLDELAERARVVERRQLRDQLLRQAAALVSGTNWAKARRIQREILTASSGDIDAVRALVREALAIDPDLAPPTSMKQLLRIVAE